MSEYLQLIEHLIRTGVLRTPLLIQAFQSCDRKLFVPAELQPFAYADHPLPIGEGQTISQPSTVAIMLELLQPQKDHHVLDIGSGSGWTTALLAYAVGDHGFVEGIERIPSLVEYARRSLKNAHIANASIELAHQRVLGHPDKTYDRILVSASAQKMPKRLFKQLKPGGIMVVPVQNSLWRISKQFDGRIDLYEINGFSFVPLIEE
jgi:protein-L-isoaspartate(D-aspartate) O-methyltransferase